MGYSKNTKLAAVYMNILIVQVCYNYFINSEKVLRYIIVNQDVVCVC